MTRLSRPRRSLLLYALPVLVGWIAIATENLHRLDERIGLEVLFRLRGPIPSPENVLIVNIDSVSSESLGLPRSVREWPRAVHACLVEEFLSAAALVVFDINFVGPSARMDSGALEPGTAPNESAKRFRERCARFLAAPEPDVAFAATMTRAGNVLLTQPFAEPRLHETVDPVVSCVSGPAAKRAIDPAVAGAALTPLNPIVSAAALAWAPFGLPNDATRIDWYWAYLPEAGSLPTLPLVAERLYRERLPARRPGHAVVSLAEDRTHGVATRLVRPMWHARPADDAEENRSCRFLNFYGPMRGGARTVAYHELLGARDGRERLGDLRDSVVFVGYAETFAPTQKDSFHTVYSRDGLNFSGVQILATAFANLLDGNELVRVPASRSIVLVTLWGIATVLAGSRLRARMAVAVIGGLCLMWLALAVLVFRHFNVWMPTAVPLLAQAPLALYIGGQVHAKALHSRADALLAAARRYLPRVGESDDVWADEYAGTREVFGVCLATDARGFTDLSQRCSPGELKSLLDSYYEALVEPIARHGGRVIDSSGDGVLAVLVAPAGKEVLARKATCLAFDMLDGVAAFNATHPEHALPTRIGVHIGSFVLASVGGPSQLFYKAVGDSIVVAARIEAANKALGTRLLASPEFADALDADTLIRPCGSFRLQGISTPVRLVELIGRKQQSSLRILSLCTEFESALAAFSAERWAEARSAFERLRESYPEDALTRFYCDESAKRDTEPDCYASPIVLLAKN